MNKPNFFMVGAPKCGTTAMAFYLNQHPDIFISNPKEPHYFLHPSANNRKIQDYRHYLNLFKRATGYNWIGEASVWYLYSNYARDMIHQFNSDAKIIIMTRNPIDFVASLHSQLMFEGIETRSDISEAWLRERENVGHCVGIETLEEAPNWKMKYPELLNHRKYIEKYVKTFGDNNVLVLSQEEMAQNCRRTYLRVLNFLGASDDGRIDFPLVNSNKIHKNQVVRKFLTWTNRPSWATTTGRKVKEFLGISTFGIVSRIRKANSIAKPRKNIPLRVREDIEQYIKYI